MPRKSKEKRYIDAEELSLAEWLQLIERHEQDRDYVLIDYKFPLESHRKEYLSTVHNKSEFEIKYLLRHFLIEGGSLGADKWVLKSLSSNGKWLEIIGKLEFARRLINFSINTWEGNTWILDLLPSYPQLAIDSINGYISAHIQFLPDGRIDGLDDAVAVIRSKYLEVRHPREVLLDLRPRDFERLVSTLYSRMGYEVELTQSSRDGGYDVEARKSGDEGEENLLIECKRYENNVGVKEARSLNGVVESKRATRGLLITTAEFTRPARDFAKETRRLTLVGYTALNNLFNKYLGANWPQRIDFHVNELERSKRLKEMIASLNQGNAKG